jgi:hypothetical protein
LEGPVIEDVGISYGHLVYFTAIRYTLLTFGILFGTLVYFLSRFGMLYQDKSGNPVGDPSASFSEKKSFGFFVTHFLRSSLRQWRRMFLTKKSIARNVHLLQ